MKSHFRKLRVFLFLLFLASPTAIDAQTVKRDYPLPAGGTVEIINNFGRVNVAATTAAEEANPGNTGGVVSVSADKSVSESEIRVSLAGGRVRLEVQPDDSSKRIDLSLSVPERARVKIQTAEGEVRVAGNLAQVEVRTETGTIAADVPLENLRYDFFWTASRPRFISDVELNEVKEKAAGKFAVSGRYPDEEKQKTDQQETDAQSGENSASSAGVTGDEPVEADQPAKESKKKKVKGKNDDGQVKLNFTTARGIMLLNVNPNEVPSDLREKPLTAAAKAIIRSGDSLLMEAIRRASPRFFGEYASTLPPLKREPSLIERPLSPNIPAANIKKVLVRVMDINNRAISDLGKDDFEVTESGEPREVLAVQPAAAPFNLVLLLDVSGSVENYVDFIRKAARAFIETASPQDRIAIIIFNEDVKQLSSFTTDKGKLSESLDTFDAGGGTAFYDALAFTLAETLRPLRGERTAIVVLSDGDDNRSFLPFDALLGSIQESGALIYPLYVPSSLIAASKTAAVEASVDPLRTKYMGLTTKAEGEGEKLAQISGGVYYQIRHLSEIQQAYDDIVRQLRTAYTVTFRSNLAETRGNGGAPPRLKVRVRRDNTFIRLGPVIEVGEVSDLQKQ